MTGNGNFFVEIVWSVLLTIFSDFDFEYDETKKECVRVAGEGVYPPPHCPPGDTYNKTIG